MTEIEARKLEVGDKVVFNYDGWLPSVCGTVIELNQWEFKVKWNDGQVGEVPYSGVNENIRLA
jgi:hypothetical protein